MNVLTKSAALLLLAWFSTTVFAISDDRVFAYAEANYPNIFAGAGAPGQYQQYNYRYYQSSGNFLAIDTSGVIAIMGPFTDNIVTPVGSASDFEGTITAWEASRATPPASADYSGTWGGSYQGFSVTYVITQSGNNLTLKSNPTTFTASQTYTGVMNGNTATVSTTDFAEATSTLTVVDSKTVSVVQNSCVTSPANMIYCMVPNGATITFTKL